MNELMIRIGACRSGVVAAFGFALLTTSFTTNAQTSIVDIPASQRIYIGTGCLRVSLDGSEGAKPQPTLADCGTSEAFRWRLEKRAFNGGRYFRIQPRSRLDLCLSVDESTLRATRPAVVVTKCHNPSGFDPLFVENTHQLWGILPVRYGTDASPFAIVAAGMSGQLTVGSIGLVDPRKAGPFVLTNSSSRRGPLFVYQYSAGDGQNPLPTQWYMSQEIFCMLAYAQHAAGRAVGGVSTPGGGQPINAPNCSS